MIVSKIQGGLGNQLFQYALGRRLALDRGVPLKLDLSWYWANRVRSYGLWHFNICAEMAFPDDIALTAGKRNDPMARKLEGQMPYYHRSQVWQQHRQFDANILNVKSPVYLHGYWQSEKYFQAIEAILRQELTLKASPDAGNQALAHTIAQVNAVSLHVRRGDYVSSPQAAKVHGLCSLAYYQRAMATVAERVKAPHFFIFSDDLAWVQENLKTTYPVTYVGQNGADKDYEDLRLMTLCQHHIIANSTFSWWGAWLGANPNKIVVAPQPWLTVPDHDPRDIIPAAWLTVPL